MNERRSNDCARDHHSGDRRFVAGNFWLTGAFRSLPMKLAMSQQLRAALRGNALVTHADKARWFRSRMRWHAREWRTWQPLQDYAEPALRRAIALRDMALFHEKMGGGLGAQAAFPKH